MVALKKLVVGVADQFERWKDKSFMQCQWQGTEFAIFADVTENLIQTLYLTRLVRED